MRFGFVVDGFASHAAVVLSQDQDRIVHADVHGTGLDLAVIERQLRRILSLDHSGAEFGQVGLRDPAIGRLQGLFPGLRPVLFNSPYEAAAWAVLSHRRQRRQATALRTRLGEALGATFQIAGESVPAFPLPERLLDLDEFPSMEPQRVERLRDVAQAALTGVLDPARLYEMGWEQALDEVQRLPGIGPMFGALIVHRAVGFADSLATGEAPGQRYLAELYGLDGPPSKETLEALTEKWRPFRTWAMVLVRVAGDRGAI
ncbi:MAG TPA: hypothetical protein VGI67_13995 [Thermoleophilaceae bacterium]|jgi:DNA-3-methyladenine glycosylase II